jgi:hypothetical protein
VVIISAACLTVDGPNAPKHVGVLKYIINIQKVHLLEVVIYIIYIFRIYELQNFQDMQAIGATLLFMRKPG